MIRSTKILLIISAALLIVGAGIFIGAMAFINWDFGKLSNAKYETNTYDINQSFENLSVDGETDAISFVLSEDKKCRVVCHELENMKHTVNVNNNTLEVKVKDTREWYEHIVFFSFESPKISVYLPKEKYSSLVINADTGAIDIPGSFSFDKIDISSSTGNVACSASSKGLTRISLSTGNININGVSSGEFDLTTSTGAIRMESVSSEGKIGSKVSTGKTFLTDVSCKSLESKGNTGNIYLKNVTASGAFSIERSTGDVEFDGSDADEITVKTSTGDVRGTLKSEKVFLTDTSTGWINVPKTTSGGRCEITTSTGNIDIAILKE